MKRGQSTTNTHTTRNPSARLFLSSKRAVFCKKQTWNYTTKPTRHTNNNFLTLSILGSDISRCIWEFFFLACPGNHMNARTYKNLPAQHPLCPSSHFDRQTRPPGGDLWLRRQSGRKWGRICNCATIPIYWCSSLDDNRIAKAVTVFRLLWMVGMFFE